MKTAELTGAALDWAVAKCEQDEKVMLLNKEVFLQTWAKDTCSQYINFLPSTDWAQGGPIIEREEIALLPLRKSIGNKWGAYIGLEKQFDATTPLEAAMRCYCCAILGEEINIPEELLCEAPKI